MFLSCQPEGAKTIDKTWVASLAAWDNLHPPPEMLLPHSSICSLRLSHEEVFESLYCDGPDVTPFTHMLTTHGKGRANNDSSPKSLSLGKRSVAARQHVTGKLVCGWCHVWSIALYCRSRNTAILMDIILKDLSSIKRNHNDWPRQVGEICSCWSLQLSGMYQIGQTSMQTKFNAACLFFTPL